MAFSGPKLIPSIEEYLDAVSLELQWYNVYPSFFTEITYALDGKVSDWDTYADNTKALKIFNKKFEYNLSGQCVKITVTRMLDGKKLEKIITYNLQGNITDVNRTYTP